MSEKMQVLKVSNSPFLASQAKKREQLNSMMPSIENVFDLMVDWILDFTAENETMKNEKGSYDEKWLEESKGNLLGEI